MRHPWKSVGLLAAVAVATIVGLGATPLPSVAGISFDIHLIGGSRGAYLIPGTPVYYVDGYNCDVYRYDNSYYAYDDDCWYRSSRYAGPWIAVNIAVVPRVVRTCYSGYDGGGYYGGGYQGGYYRDDACAPRTSYSRTYVYEQPRVVYRSERVYGRGGHPGRGHGRGNGHGNGHGNGRGPWWAD